MVEPRPPDGFRFALERFLRIVAPDKHGIEQATMLFNFGQNGKIGAAMTLAAMEYQFQAIAGRLFTTVNLSMLPAGGEVSSQGKTNPLKCERKRTDRTFEPRRRWKGLEWILARVRESVLSIAATPRQAIRQFGFASLSRSCEMLCCRSEALSP
jgi:hypothetical protein